MRTPTPLACARRRWTAVAAAALIPVTVFAAPAHADPAAEAADLRADLDTILADPSVADSGVVVLDPVTGEELYSRDADSPFVPASNMKLFTAAAALEVLGPDHTFDTEVVIPAHRGKPRTVQDVYLVGGGDPTLSAADIDALAADVAAAGVKVVKGDVYADDTWFDDERLVDDWWPEDEPYAYSAQISALTVAHGERYDTGVTEVTVTAAAQGGAPTVDLGAAEGYMELDNRATTGAAGSGNTLVVDRPVGTNTIVVSGSVPQGAAPIAVLRTVDEPAGLAGHLFERALEEHGVTVRGGVEQGEVPDDLRTRVVADHTSPDLAEIFVPYMKFSNNGHAEMLVKSIGRETADQGTWAAGRVGVEEAVAGLGVDTSGVVFHDGSGLSRTDRVTANAVVDLLASTRDADWYPVWASALPVAGIEDPFTGGTLRARMVGTAAQGAVTAKTGTMSGVSALSGYVAAPGGGDGLVFSIVNNNHTGPAPLAVQNAIAVRLAEHLGHTAPAGTLAQGARVQENPESGELECSWELTC
ncbi:D-alanyl-D-alanine carboxypeptidase/D-alanyl-D-alanine-endopeptidase [Nocardiopsis sp. N85]|uniref:D-alanyl-D-alanine carboxypeptidase/D-alanyl-D-alanine endopeptidase n=1 Tax=Nocardiopsis sp. N85 TaxID=3029400 RepID=UPI00237F8272|nr:D-alanyl-D-alanine carboxypeptidase/D-alanyl-D-alanine-endopeptidase [Nocardiopsis sp. N85]MDE3724895.1 D-alanyl-D-alanine carboxypeptidase/D-alanyl-D-alanine-endopeptidase [Nocardiopsis sp. N85]